MTFRVCTYHCWFSDRYGVYAQNITHVSAGKAKSAYFNDISPHCDWLKYTHIKVRSLGAPITDEKFLNTAKYRNVPFARVGMAVEVLGRRGLIIGSNSSANFNVVFENGEVLNCHPNWEMRFFDEQGNEIQVSEVAA